jgi:hypothetical protein
MSTDACLHAYSPAILVGRSISGARPPMGRCSSGRPSSADAQFCAPATFCAALHSAACSAAPPPCSIDLRCNMPGLPTRSCTMTMPCHCCKVMAHSEQWSSGLRSEHLQCGSYSTVMSAPDVSLRRAHLCRESREPSHCRAATTSASFPPAVCIRPSQILEASKTSC